MAKQVIVGVTCASVAEIVRLLAIKAKILPSTTLQLTKRDMMVIGSRINVAFNDSYDFTMIHTATVRNSPYGVVSEEEYEIKELNQDIERWAIQAGTVHSLFRMILGDFEEKDEQVNPLGLMGYKFILQPEDVGVTFGYVLTTRSKKKKEILKTEITKHFKDVGLPIDTIQVLSFKKDLYDDPSYNFSF
jgi:hypothetical protein